MRELPKIVKDAQRVRAALELAFTRMPRRFKYTVGLDVRAAAKAIVIAALATWRAREARVGCAQALCAAIDVLKIELQLGKDVGAFGSWREFEAIVRLVVEIGRQSGGWLRTLEAKGQNVRATPAQRAPILSSRSASPAGANP